MNEAAITFVADDPSPAVAVVIVSWNGKDLLKGCLTSLANQSFQDFMVILVDNGSSDGTVSYVRAAFPEVQIIKLEANRGFAEPSNIGIRSALRHRGIQYIITLNNDTQAEKDFIRELVDSAEQHPEVAAIQAKIINYYDQAVLDGTGMLITREYGAVNRGYRERDVGQYEQEEEVFGAAASAALFRSEALDKVALRRPDGEREYFDGDYFAYHEDVDLAWRLRLVGYRAIYSPRARVLHVHSGTGGSASPFKAYHVHRNHYFNLIKNLPASLLIGALLRMPKVYWISLTEVVKGKGSAAQLRDKSRQKGESLVFMILKGWFEVLRGLPRMLKKRRQVQIMRMVDDKEIASWRLKFSEDIAQSRPLEKQD